MARVETIAKSRKPVTCGKCHTELPVGSTYLKWKNNRFSPTRVRCTAATCRPRPSDTTSNEDTANLYAAQEAAQDALTGAVDKSDLEAVRDDLVSALDEVAESLRGKASNIEDGFQHETEQSTALNERADAVEEWKDEVENVDFDDAEVDVECPRCGFAFPCDTSDGTLDEDGLREALDAHRCLPEDAEGDEQPLPEDEQKGLMAEAEQQMEAWLDSARSALEDALNNTPE